MHATGRLPPVPTILIRRHAPASGIWPVERLHGSNLTKVTLRPNSLLESELRCSGFDVVAGVDEAGRGALAGPVFAAAVVLDMNNVPDGLNDSKKLTAKRREFLDRTIRASSTVSVGTASEEEIDGLNILNAAMLAMRRAVEQLCHHPDHLLIDGDRIPAGLPCPARPVVSGDAISVSIAAASIVAKVARDRHMGELDRLHPEYGWMANCGYGTRKHIETLFHLGPTPLHRRSFRPVREALEARRAQEIREDA